MAKKKPSINKSKAIKEYKAAHKTAKPKAIAEALQAQGHDITPGYVSTILSQAKNRKTGTGKRGRPAGSKTVRRTSRTSGRSAGRPAASSGNEVSVDALLKIKKLVSDVGGIDEVRNALQTYEKLMSDA